MGVICQLYFQRYVPSLKRNHVVVCKFCLFRPSCSICSSSLYSSMACPFYVICIFREYQGFQKDRCTAKQMETNLRSLKAELIYLSSVFESFLIPKGVTIHRHRKKERFFCVDFDSKFVIAYSQSPNASSMFRMAAFGKTTCNAIGGFVVNFKCNVGIDNIKFTS